MQKFFAAAALLGLALATSSPAPAQSLVRIEQVVAACSDTATPDQCQQFIALFIARYPQDTYLREQAIADLVVALAESPAASDPVARSGIAAAIGRIAAYATGEQQAAILQVSGIIAAETTIRSGPILVPRPESPA